MRCIDNICLLVHPLTYVDHEQEYEDKQFFRLALECENVVAARWRKRISEMGGGEALVLLPSRPDTPSMRALEDFAEEQLGERCIRVNRSNSDWQHREFWDVLPQHACRFLGEELRDTLIRRRSLGSLDDFTTGIQAYAYVEELRETLKERDVALNPEMLRTEAWGESFEGCVAKYAQMMGTYLGLKEPIEVVYEMTVPDATFLLKGAFLEKLALPDGVCVYLFKSEDDVPIGVFFETFRRPSNDVRFIRIPVGPSKVRVLNKRGKEAQIASDTELQVRFVDGCLQVQLVTGVYHNGTFVFGNGYSFDAFREILCNSSIVR